MSRAILVVLAERDHVYEFEASSLKSLKGQIYRWTFEDIEGENLESFKQWLSDNDIKRRPDA